MPADPLAAYRAYCADRPAVPLFNRPAWLDVVCGAQPWRVAATFADAGQALTFLPYTAHRRYGQTFVLQPPLCPALRLVHTHTEPRMRRYKYYGRRDREVQATLAALPAAPLTSLVLDDRFDGAVSAARADFAVQPRFSYTLDLTRSEAEQLADYKPSLRKDLRDFARRPEPITPLDPTDGYAFFRAHLRERDVGFPLSEQQWRQLADTFHPTGQWRITGIRQAGHWVAALATASDATTGYTLLSARDPQRDRHGGMAALFHEATVHARASGRTHFDFCGSQLPGVEPFLRAFGAVRTPRSLLRRYRNPLWETGLRLLGR